MFNFETITFKIVKIWRQAHLSLALLAKSVIARCYKTQAEREAAYQFVYELLKWPSKVRQTIFPSAISRQLYQVVKAADPAHPDLPIFFGTDINPDSKSATTVLILAAGSGTRWYGQGLKQLAEIESVPVIEHILKKVPQAHVITHHPQLKQYTHVEPKRREYVLETLLSTYQLWNKRTVIILGDVFFGAGQLEKVLNFKGDFGVFGSKDQVEIFALSFNHRAKSKVLQHLQVALTDAYDGGRGKLWEFYHSYAGLPLYKISFGRYFYELVNTMDIDSIDDYHQVRKGEFHKLSVPQLTPAT